MIICPTCGELIRKKYKRRICSAGHPAVRLRKARADELDAFLDSMWRLGICKRYHWNEQVKVWAKDRLRLVAEPSPFAGIDRSVCPLGNLMDTTVDDALAALSRQIAQAVYR